MNHTDLLTYPDMEVISYAFSYSGHSTDGHRQTSMEPEHAELQMDTPKDMHHSFLSCLLCCERLKDPCSLSCGHSFCKECLAEFLKTCEDAIKSKQVMCPSCQVMSPVMHPDHPLEDWLGQLKPHPLIQGFLDRSSNSAENGVSEEMPNAGSLCFSCQQINKMASAGYLCQDCNIMLCSDCVKRHRALPATKHHAIVDLQGEVRVQGSRKIMCKEHQEEIEYCCNDCTVAMCQKCSVVYHRKCDSVVTMESMADKMRAVVSDSLNSVQEVVEDLQTNINLKQTKVAEVNQNKTTVQSEIWRISQMAIDIIKEKEKKLLDSLDKLSEQQTGQLQREIQTVGTDLHVYKHLSEYMDQALRSDSKTELYEIYRMCQSGVVNSAVNTLVHVKPRCITFQNELDLSTFESSFDLGFLRLPEMESVLSRELVLQESIDIRSDGDKQDAHAFDVTVLGSSGVETVVVTDNNNNSIKSFYSRGGHMICSTLRLEHKPCTVTKLKEGKLVVAFDSHNAFLIVNVTPDLSIDTCVETKKNYRCFTVLDDQHLAGGCKDPPSIDIVDLSGNVKKSLIKRKFSEARSPWFLSTSSKGDIIVSDASINHGILCLSPKGDIVYQWCPPGINGTSGVTHTPCGEMLITDCLAQKVIQLSDQGEFKSTLLTVQHGLDSALYGICLHGDRLYLANGKEGVKVFQFK